MSHIYRYVFESLVMPENVNDNDDNDEPPDGECPAHLPRFAAHFHTHTPNLSAAHRQERMGAKKDPYICVH